MRLLTIISVLLLVFSIAPSQAETPKSAPSYSSIEGKTPEFKRTGKEFGLNVLAVGNFSSYSETPQTAPGAQQTNSGRDYTANLAPGVGVAFEMPATQALSTEIGAYYFQRSFRESSLSFAGGASAKSDVDVRTQWVSVNPMLRFYPATRVFNIGIGPYYARAVGSIRSEIGAIRSESTYEDHYLNRGDLGLAGSLQFKIPFKSRFGLVAEGRYTRGFLNLFDESRWRSDLRGDLEASGFSSQEAESIANRSSLSIHMNDVQFLLGISIVL